MKVLIVEDDRKGARILQKGLEEEGYEVELTYDGSAAEHALAAGGHDLVILDWLLPDKPGIDICRDLRRRDPSIPVLMLTAKDALSDRVAGLSTGADDYLTKPYAFWELLARIRALLRRSLHARPPLVKAGDLTIDSITHAVTRNGQPIDLTTKEYALLIALAQRAGQVVTRADLTSYLGHDSAEQASNLLDVYISHLRKKLDDGSAAPLIRTVRGRGYRLGDEQP